MEKSVTRKRRSHRRKERLEKLKKSNRRSRSRKRRNKKSKRQNGQPLSGKLQKTNISENVQNFRKCPKSFQKNFGKLFKQSNFEINIEIQHYHINYTT